MVTVPVFAIVLFGVITGLIGSLIGGLVMCKTVRTTVLRGRSQRLPTLLVLRNVYTDCGGSAADVQQE